MNLIDVLVLPAHTTHITQMFDVCLASPLKSTYSKIFDTLLNEVAFTDNSPSIISKIRRCALAAIISSWLRRPPMPLPPFFRHAKPKSIGGMEEVLKIYFYRNLM